MILRDETTGQSKDFNTNREDYMKALTEIKILYEKGHVLSGEALEKVEDYFGHLFD